jgi:hypothetical protein
LWADVIIGKSDFGAVSPYTTAPNKGFWDFGTIVDRSSPGDNKLYLYDAGNNRILGFRLDGPGGCLSRPGNPVLNCSANIAIGQPSLSLSGCNGDSAFQNWPSLAIASNVTLCGQEESQPSIAEGASGASMAVNAQGDLYVADHWNHRVLKFPAPFSQSGLVTATDVWGQPDYAARTCNGPNGVPGPTTLCFGTGGSNNWTAGVEVEQVGGDYNVWVADSQNNRVLRFPPGSHTADLVIGQSSFTSTTPGNDSYQINAPAALRISPTTGKLYVADQGNNRLMVYTPPFTTGMSGLIFGPNPDPDPSDCPAVNVQRFCRPSGLEFDPDQASRPGVWVNNTYHYTWERWSESNAGGSPSEVIGVVDDGNRLAGGTGSMGITAAGKRLISAGAGEYGNNVLIFDPTFSNTSPWRLLFGESPGGNDITATGISSGRGVAVSDNQLIVADLGRILFWNNPTSVTGTLLLANGQAANGAVAPQASGVITFGTRITNCCTFLKADANHHLWVSADGTDRIYAYSLPLTNNSHPIASFTFPFSVLGGGTLNGIPGLGFAGLAPSANGDYLWASHPDTNRTIRIRNPLSGSRQVDVVLGQTTLGGTQCNRGGAPRTGALPNSLCNPGHLSLDRQGNLFVSDSSLESRGNMRLLEFNSSLLPLTNTQTLLGLAASKIYADVETLEPAFDSQNRMVVGYNFYWSPNPGPTPGGNSRFPGVYYNPLSPSASVTPSAFLRDFYSMGFAATFDNYDNLYVGDLNRSRVLVYRHPLQVIAGHVTWQGRPAQPSALQQLPITLTIKAGATEVNYPSTTTDASGVFTVPINGLATGPYSWRVKGPKFLANSGTLALAGDGITGVDMGQIRAGDCNDDNVVNVNDFNILKNAFGKTGCPAPEPGYDGRADFNGDCLVNLLDENLLVRNYGQSGAPPS